MVQLQSKVLRHHINIEAFPAHGERRQANRSDDTLRTVMKALGTERKDTEWGLGSRGSWKHFQSRGSRYVSLRHPVVVNFMCEHDWAMGAQILGQTLFGVFL